MDSNCERCESEIGSDALGLEFAPPVVNSCSELQFLLPGDQVGDFQIERRIGAGGMGVVYEAVDRVLARKVALKFVRTSVTTAPCSTSLLHEARATACLEHERFVRVYSLDTLPNGQTYMVMERLHGRNLRKWLNEKHSVEHLLDIFCQLAEGLSVAHHRGIVHRDVKPENVFVTHDNRVKILDLGLAGLVEETFSSTLLRAGLPHLEAATSGTPAYLSPECWRGATPSPGFDVWAVGVMLYEAMSRGLHPFWMPHLDLQTNVQRVLHLGYSRLPPKSGADAAWTPFIDRIIERALDKNPSERFSDAAELLDALQELRSKRGEHSAKKLGFLLGHVLLPYVKQHASLGALVALTLLGARDSHVEQPTKPSAGMVFLSGGTFTRGSSPAEIQAAHRFCLDESSDPRLCVLEQLEREQPQQHVTVSPFWLDRTEVTNQQYAEWINQLLQEKKLRVVNGRTILTSEPSSEKLADFFPAYRPSSVLLVLDNKLAFSPELARLPVSQVTWEGARRYCAAHGKRLPTEAEWEYAAQGGGQAGFRFPWGSRDPSCEGVVAARDTAKLSEPNGVVQIRLRCMDSFPSGPVAVGSSKQDVSPQGVHDLAGNLAEWVEDPFVERYPDCGTCIDPVAPLPASYNERPLRVFRGGSWTFLLAHTRSAARSRYDARAPSRDVGFRCAKSEATAPHPSTGDSLNETLSYTGNL